MMYFLAFIIPLLIVIPSYVFVSAMYLKTKFADTTKIKANIRLCEILNISSFLIFSLLLPLGIISLYAGYQNLYWVTAFAVMFTIVSVVLFVIFIVSEILIRVKTGINANRKNNKGSEKAIYLTAVIGDLMLLISILCFVINWLIWDDFYVFMICSFIIFVVCYITAAILYLKRNSGKAGLKRLVVPAISFVLMFVISGYCFTHGKCGENTKWSFTIDKYLEISGSGDVNTDDLDFNLAICSLLAEDVVIWDGVESIDYSQFWQRSKLNNVYFSDSIEIINGGAFKDCTSLSLEDNGLPDNLKSIGSESFMNCDSITSVTIPDSVTEIGDGAFWGCDSLESVYIPQGITVINENTFADCDKLRKIVIPSSVKSIEIYAFYKCSNLEVYYDGSEEQWNQIFVDERYNEGLENATVHYNSQGTEDSVVSTVIDKGECGESINWFLYENGELLIKGDGDMYSWASESEGASNIAPWSAHKNKITTVTIGQGINNISRNSFNGCVNMENISIGKDVTLIKSDSFSNCQKLKSITIPASVNLIESDAFKNCSSLEKINVEDGNLYYSSDKHGVLFYNKTELVQYPLGNKRNTYVIPDEVTEIRSSAFYGCQNLESIVFPTNITYIGDYAFKDCVNLKEIDFHFWSSWDYYGDYGCIGDYAFSGCKKLTMDILWMDYAWHIGSYAFDGCTGIKELYIGEATEEIGAYAFNGWTSQQDIYIIGTSDNWKSGWDAGCNAAFPSFHG